MIFGIGYDIVDNKRISALFNSFGVRFVNKILSEDEFNVFLLHKNKEKYLAKRFAAKEAFAKACGTGLRAPIGFTSISVLNDDHGKPILYLSDQINEWLKQRNIIRTHISLTDEKAMSGALVILEAI